MGPMDPVKVLVVDEKLQEPCVYRRILERNDCQCSFREFSEGSGGNVGPSHRRHRPQFAQDPRQEHPLVNRSVFGFTRQRVLLIAPRRELLVGACSQTRKGVPWNGCLSAERLRRCV